MAEAEQPVPVFSRIPVYTGRSGQTLVSTEMVIMFIRSVAKAAEEHGDLEGLAGALRREADALECQAIEHTREPR